MLPFAGHDIFHISFLIESSIFPFSSLFPTSSTSLPSQTITSHLNMTHPSLPSKKTALSWTAIFSALLLGLWTRSGEKSGSPVVVRDIWMFGGQGKEEFICTERGYTTEVISVDPLMVYINGFVTGEEAKGLIDIGFVLFHPIISIHLSRANTPPAPQTSPPPKYTVPACPAGPPSQELKTEHLNPVPFPLRNQS